MEVKLVFSVICLVIAITISFLQNKTFTCWLDNGNSVIEDQCKRSEVVGNMCHVVCSALNTDCHLYHASKNIVRVVELADKEMVVKHKGIDILTKEYVQSLLPLGDEDEPLDSIQDMLQSLVDFELNRKDSEDIVSLLWPWQNSSLLTEPNRPVMEQIVRFAHNDEYKLMQLHHDLKLFPAILGTCGDVYVVEHVTLLLDRPLLDLLPAFTNTCHVVRSVRRILSYLLHLSSVLPLHLCDLQWGHFGAGDDGLVRFVDLDAAFSAEKIAATQTETFCDSNADCDFFDCLGTCDTTTGRCRSEVSDNVSNLCRQLVWPRAPLLGAERRLGLLGAVLSDQQARLLERCARSRSAQHAQEVAEMLTALGRRLCGEE